MFPVTGVTRVVLAGKPSARSTSCAFLSCHPARGAPACCFSSATQQTTRLGFERSMTMKSPTPCVSWVAIYKHRYFVLGVFLRAPASSFAALCANSASGSACHSRC